MNYTLTENHFCQRFAKEIRSERRCRKNLKKSRKQLHFQNKFRKSVKICKNATSDDSRSNRLNHLRHHSKRRQRKNERILMVVNEHTEYFNIISTRRRENDTSHKKHIVRIFEHARSNAIFEQRDLFLHNDQLLDLV